MMVTRLKKVWLAAVAVAVLQTAALGWMVFERVQLLQSGREIVLPIVPVDPRSLFRGDYVNLSYGVTRIPGDLIAGEVKRGERLYVTIERKADETYVPVAVSRSHPGEVKPDQFILRGRAQNFRRTGRFSTGNIFVPMELAISCPRARDWSEAMAAITAAVMRRSQRQRRH